MSIAEKPRQIKTLNKRLIILRIRAVQHPFYCSKCGWSGSWAGSRCPECGA